MRELIHNFIWGFSGEPEFMVEFTIAGSSAPYHTVVNRHVFESLAFNARIALHVRTLYGRDPGESHVPQSGAGAYL